MDSTAQGIMPKVFIIIPVYKTEKYLQACVESVVVQDYADLQILLVDDGSPDGSPKLCDALAEQYANVRAIHKTNGGLSSARNAGLEHVPEGTKYVLFLDSDDRLAAGSVAGLAAEAMRTKAEIVMPDRYEKVFEESGKTQTAFLFSKQYQIEDPIQFALDVVIENARAWRATSVLYSYDLLKRTGARFPEGYISEDIVFNLQLYGSANRIAFYPHATLLNLKRTGSISSSFTPGLEKSFFYIDACARKFTKKAGVDPVVADQKTNALLCRNMVVFFFSIMSSKNPMDKAQKQKYIFDLLDDARVKKAVRQKHKVPNFERRTVRAAFAVVYFLMRHGWNKAMITLLETVRR